MIITKQTRIFNSSDLSEGSVLLIDKPKGKTSFDAVWWVRKKLQIKKVGHAGTLDPAATGLLIVCTGKKTKEISKFQELHKVYTGVITLGATTASMDQETELENVKDVKELSEEKIYKIRDSFLGEIEQIPPMFSALKHKGRSLYKYARKGIEVKREPRKVSIYNFRITEINIPYISFEIECSKGTYIRVIANDFGMKTGYGGYLGELRRTKIGDYDVNNALTLEELTNLEINFDVQD
ncbi:MAG: tRNA pseudouridine(55) synthase TruB [Ignavibacteriales bacterium]|nr:tRNA pseudouridine(55) synthase TruB [Ignavibacteriota bacterium]MCB9248964.1 tRNA pseudouridine(55) synthase TruB [Ignavibacteriales bacterium]